MISVRVGTALAVLIAGPPLYALVQSGDMDATTAVERGAVVLIGCAIGASMIFKMIDAYGRAEQVTQARKAARIEKILNGLVPDEPSQPVVSRPSPAPARKPPPRTTPTKATPTRTTPTKATPTTTLPHKT